VAVVDLALVDAKPLGVEVAERLAFAQPLEAIALEATDLGSRALAILAVELDSEVAGGAPVDDDLLDHVGGGVVGKRGVQLVACPLLPVVETRQRVVVRLDLGQLGVVAVAQLAVAVLARAEGVPLEADESQKVLVDERVQRVRLEGAAVVGIEIVEHVERCDA
jgi:hypothetical protein